MSGSVAGRFQTTIPLSNDAATAPLTLTVDPSGATCKGQLTSARQGRLGGTCTLADGRVLALSMRVGLDESGAFVGTIQVSGAGEPTDSTQVELTAGCPILTSPVIRATVRATAADTAGA